MLLNMTPAGNEFERKLLLDHSSKIRTMFILDAIIVIVAIALGCYYSPKTVEGDSSYMKNVAMILVDSGNNQTSQGTAFLVSDQSGQTQGYLLTARHVIADTKAKQVLLMFPYIKNENDEPLITAASIVWTTDIPFDGNDINSLRYDVALLKIDDPTVLPDDVSGFFIGTEPEIKEKISIYGFPSAEGYAVDGQIANIEFRGTSDLMTLSMQIDHGLSGAPIYSEETGEALGIAIASGSQTDIQNIAITLKRALELMDQAGINIH